MTSLFRTATLAVGVLIALTASGAGAQGTADLSGHWAGSIDIPGQTIVFQTDFARNDSGQWAGAIAVQSDDSDGAPFPLNRIAVDGTSVTFYARSDSSFDAVLSGDGTTMSGTMRLGGYRVPFSLRRTGAAQLPPPPASAAVDKALEGDWTATLEVGGKSFRLVLTIANRPDGTAIARILDLDEGGLVIPVIVTQNGSRVSYESRGVRSSYAGDLDAAGTQLAGTWTQHNVSAPLVFRHVVK